MVLYHINFRDKCNLYINRFHIYFINYKLLFIFYINYNWILNISLLPINISLLPINNPIEVLCLLVRGTHYIVSYRQDIFFSKDSLECLNPDSFDLFSFIYCVWLNLFFSISMSCLLSIAWLLFALTM